MKRLFFKKNTATASLVYTAFFVMLGVLVPFLTAHAFGIPGIFMLPMHFPVLLCGFLLGPKKGFVCGLLSPLLSSLLTGMPVFYPMLPIMIIELPLYGLMAGLLYKVLKLPIPIALAFSMIIGRVGYGIMFAILFAFNPYLRALTVWGAILTGLPGIVVQLYLIPAILYALTPKKHTKTFFQKRLLNPAKVRKRI